MRHGDIPTRRHYDDSDNNGRDMHLNPNDTDENRSVALYWDFENLHAGLMEAKYGEGAYTLRVAPDPQPADSHWSPAIIRSPSRTAGGGGMSSSLQATSLLVTP